MSFTPDEERLILDAYELTTAAKAALFGMLVRAAAENRRSSLRALIDEAVAVTK